MAQYIDKDALVQYLTGMVDSSCCDDNTKRIIEKIIIPHINTLEVKKVDLEKYYHEFLEKEWFGNSHVRTVSEMMAFTAKHFFELGLKARTDKELIEEIYSHIDSIKDIADRMTSGNFMHNIAAIKFSANTIANVLELMGLKAQKGE